MPQAWCYDLELVIKIQAGTIFPGSGTPCIDTIVDNTLFDIFCVGAQYNDGKVGCDSSYFSGTFQYRTRPCGSLTWGPPVTQGFGACNAQLYGADCDT